MSNFIEEFNRGQSDAIKGLPFGEGLESITAHTNGISKGRIYAIAGPEKSGKTTFTDYAFVIQPYLFAVEYGIEVNWEYYSFEIDRVSKEFDFMTYFLHHDYGVERVALEEGSTRKGEDSIPLSPDYLKGLLLDDNNKPIKVIESLIDPIKETYEKRIVPLFGEYSDKGIRLKKGVINFKEGRENPTGIYKDLLSLADKEGELIKDSFGRYLSFNPYNRDAFKIVIIDHIRKVRPERNWKMKETIDKMSEYLVDLRDLLKYTFVPIIHTNRNLASTDRLKFLDDDVYPTSDDLKDSGNIGEDCNYLFTTFNPNDDKYQLKEHFGMKIRDNRNNIIYPNLKTIHLVSSRHCEFPRHFKTNMIGNLKKFEKL